MAALPDLGGRGPRRGTLRSKVCGPSVSGAVGVNVQPAAAVPHAEQATPVVDDPPLSTFASIRAMTLPNACAVPE